MYSPDGICDRCGRLAGDEDLVLLLGSCSFCDVHPIGKYGVLVRIMYSRSLQIDCLVPSEYGVGWRERGW